jgi:uncharacterized Tic20 family protein
MTHHHNYPPPQVQPPPPPPPGYGYAASMSPDDVNNWAMLIHLSALSALIVGLGGVLGPLIFWLIKRNDHPAIDAHGRAALNFQLTMLIATVVAVIATFVGAVVTFGIILAVAVPALIALSIFWLVQVILASIRANRGELHRYAMAVQFFTVQPQVSPFAAAHVDYGRPASPPGPPPPYPAPPGYAGHAPWPGDVDGPPDQSGAIDPPGHGQPGDPYSPEPERNDDYSPRGW